MHIEELQSDQKNRLEMQTNIRFQVFPDRWTDRQQESRHFLVQAIIHCAGPH
jgi:hypothetical protein